MECRLKTLDAIATSSSGKIGSVITLATSNSVRDTPTTIPSDVQFEDNLVQFPVYSYKHCKPLPTVVYTQHEEEANNLIAGLKAGYAFSINIFTIFRCRNCYLQSPIALDIEWRVFFVRQNTAAPRTLLERRAAVVQVADSSGLILVIQVYCMSRMLSAATLLLYFPCLSQFVARISNSITGRRILLCYR